MEQNRVRLNKFLSESGVCSRREADRLIASGAITVNGERAVLGMTVSVDDTVICQGKTVKPVNELVLLLFHKPRGIVCTAEKREPNNIVDYLNYPLRIYPVGRLDKDSEGLILLTNDGDLVNKIMRSGNYHEKEYVVTVNQKITPEFLKQMGAGVPILDTITRPCSIWQTGEQEFRIILTQGLNRQIRRMCEYLGYQVKRLKRVRIMNLTLDQIPCGQYRLITPAEQKELNELLKDSTSLPWQERSQKEKT